MYVNCAYLNNSIEDFEDKSRPLVVGSCGTYRLYSRAELLTYRPQGRVDYQLLYIASGKAHFVIDGKERSVSAGHMVLYRPKEMQKYVYYGVEQTEVYWVHFTGSAVGQLLKKYGMDDEKKVFYSSVLPEYQNLYRKMIRELQMCRAGYQEMLSLLLQQIFVLIYRQSDSYQRLKGSFLSDEVDFACTYFDEHYSEKINIQEFAESRHMGICWFIRMFRQQMGISPMQYVLSIRIANAQNLLAETDYNITEISNMVGYENPLYFSRVFKKAQGMAPTEYRKRMREKSAQQ